VFMKW